jgi:hypothetical protein
LISVLTSLHGRRSQTTAFTPLAFAAFFLLQVRGIGIATRSRLSSDGSSGICAATPV